MARRTVANFVEILRTLRRIVRDDAIDASNGERQAEQCHGSVLGFPSSPGEHHSCPSEESNDLMLCARRNRYGCAGKEEFRPKAMAIRVYNVALVGFGNVGKELVRLLVAKETELRRDYNIGWRLTGAASRRVGWVANANGLDATALLNHSWPEPPAGRPPTNVREWLAESKADILFEATSLDRRTGYPATDHLKAAREYGAHAISANKGPIVHAYDELRELARAKGRRFLFESTVMDGTPIFSMFPYGLPAVELRGFRGILNSTTNVVLTQMEKDLRLHQAATNPEEIGVAETDPADHLDR